MALVSSSGQGSLNVGRGGYHPSQPPVEASTSSAAGSLGTQTLGGTGDTIAGTSVSAVSGQRNAIDPYSTGIVYTVVSGTLPTGYTLNALTGSITGTYPVSGVNTDGTVWNFTIRASDSNTAIKQYADRAYSVTLSVPWLYRQIITTVYMAGGYQNSALWSNANRFPRSTETCTNLGDGLIDAYHYKSGMCDTDRGHIWNGNSTTTFSMRTETKVNGVGVPGFGTLNTGTTFSPDRNRSFTVGEGVSNCFRFTASTNAFAALGGGQGGMAAGISGENKGIWWGDANRSINFSTEGQATISMAGGAHGQQKGLSAKTGYGYGGNEGTYNGGFNLRKINISAESYTTIQKPISSGAGAISTAGNGEENYAMTQDRGYILGEYNGPAQNNNCGRLIYSTDVVATLGTTVQGHGGASSGHCFWRD